MIKRDPVLAGSGNSVTTAAAGIDKLNSGDSLTSKIVGSACEFIPLTTVSVSTFLESDKTRAAGIATIALGGAWEVVEEFRKLGPAHTPNDPQQRPQINRVMAGCAKIGGAMLWAWGTWNGDSKIAGSGLALITTSAALREGGTDKLHRPAGPPAHPELGIAARSSVPNPPQPAVAPARPAGSRSIPAVAVPPAAARRAASPARR